MSPSGPFQETQVFKGGGLRNWGDRFALSHHEILAGTAIQITGLKHSTVEISASSTS
ncbi:MAG: hypothetical protein AB1486_00790 [Planctomycetota bacterium]